MARITAFLLSLVLIASAAFGAPSAETKAQKDARMKWWREARFGMFIHWGLYAVPAGHWDGKPVGGAGEWLMNTAQVKAADYEPLVNQFNPVKFDAKAWVKLAKDAGMKYIVITSKHHDGFCMFETKQTDYNIMSTPYGRDVMKDLAAECKRQGIRFCFYHSIMDWHHPNYAPRRQWDPRPELPAPDFSKYVAYLKAELKELLTNYGPLGILWFDGQWEGTWTEPQGEDLYAYVRSLQPQIIVNNRVGKGKTGDYGTPEQEIPATGIPGMDWESCMTMNDTWGFHQDDHNWKGAATLVRNLVDCASKGGNYLLNVGPTAEGLIPEESVSRLERVGAWMKANGEAVYATGPSPFKKLAHKVTTKPGKLFVTVFDWPQNGLELPGLKNKVKRAYFLTDSAKRELRHTSDANGVWVALPGRPLDSIATVVVVEIEGKPKVDEPVLKQAADGSMALPAVEAVVKGSSARYESTHDNIGYWTNPGDTVSWTFDVTRKGEFEVVLEQACEPADAGAEYEVSVAGQVLRGVVSATQGWGDFVTKSLGKVRIAKAGRVVLTVTPKKMPNGAVMNLRKVTLVPVK